MGSFYTLAIKCGSKIIVGQPSDSSRLNEDWFIKYNQRLQYIKYAGEGANFPYHGFLNCNSLRRIDTVNPYKEINIARQTDSVYLNYNISSFDFSKCVKIINAQFSLTFPKNQAAHESKHSCPSLIGGLK